MAWPKGKGRRAAGSGRKKGVQNHLTTALKDLILQALANAGGVDYLTQQAKDDAICAKLAGMSDLMFHDFEFEVGVTEVAATGTDHHKELDGDVAAY